jgi:hypothetical protein
VLPTKPDAEQRELYVSRIIAAWHHATPEQRELGRHWYRAANGIARQLADGDAVKGAGVIAALSPQKEWQLNKRMAAKALRGEPVGHLADALRKVAAIMAGADPADILPMALKTGNFYRNIIDPSDPDPVTVDRHAHDVVAGVLYVGRGGKDTYGDRGLSNVNRYAALAHCYREAGYRIGELPNVVQAGVWEAQTAGTLNAKDKRNSENGTVLRGD